MFNKKLIVYVARLDGTKYSYSPRSLIDAVCNEDGTARFPFQAFKCHPKDVCEENLIDRRDAKAMTAESGVFTVVESHAGSALAIISIVLSVASAIYAYTQTSNLPSAADLGQSSNNSLSNRVNKERPKQRIEDIAGEDNSVPTLIQLPYRKWIDKKEVEYSYMCISVGSGVPVNPRDGDTPIEIMDGSGAQFYAPNTSPNNSSPEYSFGQSFNEPISIIKRSNEVAGGEVLDTINDYRMDIGNKGRLNYIDDAGRVAGISDILYFSDYFIADDVVDVVGGFSGDDGASLAGRYKVQSSSGSYLFLVAEDGSPANTVNANWDILVGPGGGMASDGLTITKVGAEGLTYAGPFFLSGKLSGFYLNLTANGLITDSGSDVSIGFDVEYAQADDDGNMIGDWSTPVSDSISGRTRDNIGATVEVSTPFIGNILIRLRRTTDRIPAAQLQDLTIDALYSIESIEAVDFGNVQLVQRETKGIKAMYESLMQQRRCRS